MGPPTREDCDVDYLFGQVNINLPRIDWASNCGNISAGAAANAAYKGYVKPADDKVKVSIHQVNTGRRLLATVPYSIKTVAKSFNRKNTTYSMGLPCNLYPCKGPVINELTSVEILTGAKAYPIAAGGLAGAEGSITLIIKGTEEQIKAAVRYAEEVKGAKLPPVEIRDCETCTAEGCSLSMAKKHWT